MNHRSVHISIPVGQTLKEFSEYSVPDEFAAGDVSKMMVGINFIHPYPLSLPFLSFLKSA